MEYSTHMEFQALLMTSLSETLNNRNMYDILCGVYSITLSMAVLLKMKITHSNFDTNVMKTLFMNKQLCSLISVHSKTCVDIRTKRTIYVLVVEYVT